MTNPSVALLGSRGIPARYGGYETLLEGLAPDADPEGRRDDALAAFSSLD